MKGITAILPHFLAFLPDNVSQHSEKSLVIWPPDVVNVKPDVDTLLTVPDAPPEAGPDRALDLEGWVVVELEEVELVEEAVAVPLLLLPQAARIAVAASKRKVTLTNVFIFSDSDVRIDIFFPSFYVYKWGNIPDNETIKDLW
jgi:hypothetical protein